MRKFRVLKTFVDQWDGFGEPKGYRVLTEDEIMVDRGYFDYWIGKMVGVNRRVEISWNACLEDWATEYFAEEVVETI